MVYEPFILTNILQNDAIENVKVFDNNTVFLVEQRFRVWFVRQRITLSKYLRYGCLAKIDDLRRFSGFIGTFFQVSQSEIFR